MHQRPSASVPTGLRLGIDTVVATAQVTAENFAPLIRQNCLKLKSAATTVADYVATYSATQIIALATGKTLQLAAGLHLGSISLKTGRWRPANCRVPNLPTVRIKITPDHNDCGEVFWRPPANSSNNQRVT